MRPNKIGWFIVTFFLIGGIAFWIVMPEIFIGQIWVAVSVFLILYYLRMSRKADAAEDMKRTGIRGQAQILEMTQTGVYVNEQPRVKLKLLVQAPNVAPFEDERTITVPMIALGQLSNGIPLTVYMKPEDPRGYVIDWSGGAPGGGMTVQQTGAAPVGLGSSPAAQEAVMNALKEHGIDPSSGSVDLRNLPAAREAVLKALRDHGVDAAHQVAASDPSTPVQDTGEPMERLLKLEQLRAAKLISQQEFEANKKRILEGI